MSEFGVSTRYAKALMELVESKNAFDTVAKDMEFALNTLKDSRELRKTIASPIIDPQKKISILTEIFQSRISEISLNFLKFIIEKNRDNLFTDIVSRFIELRDEKLGIINITVTTAVELPDVEKQKMESKLSEFSGKKVRAKYKVDERIIGGFTVKLKDTVIDASVKNQLKTLRKLLLEEKSVFN